MMKSTLGHWRRPLLRTTKRVGSQLSTRPFSQSTFREEQDNTPTSSFIDDAKAKFQWQEKFIRRVYLKEKSARANKNKIRDGILVHDTIDDVRAWRRQKRSENRKVGMVPTMGALHEGHLSLMRQAAEQCDEVVVSIFVNPAQFGPTEDLSTYPKTWEEDLNKIRELNNELRAKDYKGSITAIFAPKVSAMYPGATSNLLPTNLSYVTIDPALTGILEGAARPTFFRGVTTIVMKLFWIVQPDKAYFGQKDFQQLAVIRRMVRDFAIPIDICMGKIVRGPGGLALSSRNAYLGERRRQVATTLIRALHAGKAALRSDEFRRQKIVDAISAVLTEEIKRQRRLAPEERALFDIEYISMADVHDLREVDDAREARSIVLSGTIIMRPLERPNETEVLGIEGDAKPVRLLDNTVWTHSPEHPENDDDDPTPEMAWLAVPTGQRGSWRAGGTSTAGIHMDDLID